MSALTGDFLANRQKLLRYRRFLLPAGIFLLIAAAVATGFLLFEKSPQKKSSEGEKTAMQTLPREWLLKYFGVGDENDSRVGGLAGDPDLDILTNQQEFFFGTDPTDPDSDNDGQGDGAETAVNSNPLGEGELYSTDIAKKIADQFVAYNNLPEFKQENIEKQVLGILNPPKVEDLKAQVPDPKALKITRDNSPAAIESYLQKIREVSGGVNYSEEALRLVVENPNGTDAQLALSHIYELINEMREISVPSDWLPYHQLNMAGLFAAANVLSVAKTIDSSADIETQQAKLQEQYYQVALIQRIDTLLTYEYLQLKEKYKDIVKAYESIQ